MKSTHLVDIGAIIPAAGRGQRMRGQGNKLLLELAGTPVLVYTLKTFEDSPYIKEIVVPASLNDMTYIENIIRDNGFKKVKRIVEGGNERQDSVSRAIEVLSPDIRKVVVHDGARPLLTTPELNTFLNEADEFEAAIMAIPLKDTIKKVDEQGWVVETPRREEFRAIQTPQVFDRDLLVEAHKKAAAAGYYSTDDASLLEWHGYKVKILIGSYDNIKVTTPEDMLLAEAILQRRKGDRT